MKLPKPTNEQLTPARYREYLKLLPPQEKENITLFIYLALTFGAFAFFGLFAINPTITTILKLQKELEENKQVSKQLQTKTQNMSNLHQQFSEIEPDLRYVYDAIPKTAEAPLLSAQIAALLKKHNLSIESYRVAQVQIMNDKKAASKQVSYIFTLQATGNYEQMLTFSNELAKLSRIVTIESMSIGRDVRENNLVLTIRGRQYFLP